MWPFNRDKTAKVAPLPSEFLQEEVTDTFVPSYFGAKHSAPVHDAPGIRKDLQSSNPQSMLDGLIFKPLAHTIDWSNAFKFGGTIAPQKIAGRKPNVANLVLRDMLLRFPELASRDYEDVWFTGSRVWHHVYSELVQPSSDTDIYCETYATYCKVLGLYNWWGCTAIEKNWDRSVGGNDTLDVRTAGKKITTPNHGVIDIWYPLGTLSATNMIKSYPDASHSQAKCAFNFHQGLIILPNINANF